MLRRERRRGQIHFVYHIDFFGNNSCLRHGMGNGVNIENGGLFLSTYLRIDEIHSFLDGRRALQ